jgi:hypothetical protein
MRSNLFVPVVSIFFIAFFGLNRAAFGVQTSPINAGCYIAEPGKCLIHVDPFAIKVTPGRTLSSFKLLASGTPIYQLATDVSNPPIGNYTPSASKMDFAVSCGQSYTLALSAKDSGDASYIQIGSTPPLACPDGAGWLSWIPKASTERGISRAKGSVSLRGIANAQGGLTQVTFQYGKTSAYGQEVTAAPSGFADATNHNVSAVVTGLDINGTYHFRIVVQNSLGTVYGQDQVVKASGVNLVPIYMLLLD